MPIWKNPEFVRHFRAELRPTRALTVAAVVVVIAVLIWLACWGSRASEMALLHNSAAHFPAERLAEMDRQSPVVVWFGFYRILMYAQLGILTFWSLFSCAHSVEFVVVLIFIASDITFIQWCRLTRMRAPVLKGILFVGLYYVAAVVLSTVVGVYSEALGRSIYTLLTPVGAFQTLPGRPPLEVLAAVGIQLAGIVLLEMAIVAKLRHSVGEEASS